MFAGVCARQRGKSTEFGDGRVSCNNYESTGATDVKEFVSEASASGRQSADAQELPASLREVARQDRVQVCDKVIAVFRAKPSTEWRKLIAFSKQWGNLHESLFARLEHRIQTTKTPKEKVELRKLARKLRPVHEELQQHNSVLHRFVSTPESDWEALVVSGRGSLSVDFFSHLENLITANHNDDTRADELARIATRLLMLVEACDKVTANQAALEAAGQDLQSLFNQVKSVEDADKRIDELATSGRLTPALMLTMAKAYSAAKDTDYTKEEVKDVMAHLYFKAKESFAAQQPKAVRILKHLLYIESPTERREAMEQAFSPGAQLSTTTEDYLSTTPDELNALIEAILEAFDSKRGGATQMQTETNALMNPAVIEKMRRLHAELRSHFL